jgi:hypothetical protein
MSFRMIAALERILRATMTVLAALDRTVIYQIASMEAMGFFVS